MSVNPGTVEWYLARNGQQHGPLSETELDKFIELGHLQPTDLLWRAGFDDWRGAAEVFPPLPPKDTGRAKSSAEPATQPVGTKNVQGDHAQGDVAAGAKNADDASEIAPERADVEPTLSAGLNDGATTRANERRGPDADRQERRAPTFEPVSNPARGVSGEAPNQRAVAAADAVTQRHSPAGLDRPGEPRRDGRDANRDARPVGAGGGPGAHGHFSERPQNGQMAGQAVGHATRQAAGPYPTQDTARMQPASTPGHASRSPVEDPDDDAFVDDEPTGRSGWLTVAAAMFVFVILGAGGLFAYNNQQAIMSFYNDLASPKATSDVAIVRAPARVAREAPATATPAETSVIARLNQQPTPPEIVRPVGRAEKPLPEVPLLKSKLWQFAQKEFGEWTEKRLEYVRELAEQNKPKEEANTYLVNSFVKFRRDNAAVALAASPAKLEKVAAAFVESLRALTRKDANACYAFISNGESTPEVAPLYFERETGSKLEAQMLAIMQAIVDGRTAPSKSRPPPSAGDFNKLSAELGKRGWTAADLQLFSDPDALSKAKPEVVCRLVTEWFATQTTLADRTARDQLIAASLRPVIGG